ncbi:hypothetical protein PQI66_11200 [Corynebacterium sp. USCH3]|uniref:hypothetical protein n=1 Tax=Corynebacterium sp. USCH3 TaxID=3024840 RepID=UPI0030A4218B
MTADPLDTFAVMRELRQLRNQAEVDWESLTDPGSAADFLARTGELNDISTRVGELSAEDARLCDLRDLAFARAVAAKTLGRATDVETALSLVAVLSLAAAGTDTAEAARRFLDHGDRERDVRPGSDVDFSAVAEHGGSAGSGDAEEPEALSWEVRIASLARGPFTEGNDRLWDELIAACRGNLAAATGSGELSALQHCLRDLMGVITDDPAVASPHLRPEVIARAVELHRLQQRVMDELGDSIGARHDRNRFFQGVLSQLSADMPAAVPLSDRILVARYHLDLSPDVTGHGDAERSRYATRLAELYQRNGDHNGEIMAFLDKGACLEKMGRYAEMYEVYEQSLRLSRRYGLVSGVIWSTIRLSYAHFLAKDPRTATQLLLDLDGQLTNDEVSGVNEREAFAEAKVALGSLFAYAGSEEGARRYHGEAAELFTSIGNTTRAWECRQKALG